MPPFFLFDDALVGEAFILQDWVRSDTLAAAELPHLDAQLQAAWAKGLHTALCIGYEFGLPLQKLPARQPENPDPNGDSAADGRLHLHLFARKNRVADVEAWLAAQGGEAPAGISTPQADTDAARYARDIAVIQAAIARGDTYQINHTLRLHLAAYGSPVRLYARLRQRVPYAALACLPNGGWILCFSPELFLRIAATGAVETEPMKGTAPILGDGGDAARAAALQNDPKNRAENTMIVDLLRNDLGKIATVGSVRVPDPFAVSAFGSVWQMTSRVCAQMPPGTGAAALLAATFPCGSITGAPKRKSMEIIAGRERSPRGLYTGSIGFLQPEAGSVLGFSGCLNVAIRTLLLRPEASAAGQDGLWRGVYGVGSGIVADSVAADEYAECGWKSRLLTELRPEFGLLETMRAENGRIALLPLHRQRLAASARALNIPLDLRAVDAALAAALRGLAATGRFRVRLHAAADGSLNITSAPLPPLADGQRVLAAAGTLPDRAPLRRHKTDRRAGWDALWQQAVAQGAFDTLVFNHSGLLLEGGRSSVMVRYRGRWLTPAADLDILDGIARRQALLEGKAEEAHITRQMWAEAEAVRLGNALHGWFDVVRTD